MPITRQRQLVSYFYHNYYRLYICIDCNILKENHKNTKKKNDNGKEKRIKKKKIFVWIDKIILLYLVKSSGVLSVCWLTIKRFLKRIYKAIRKFKNFINIIKNTDYKFFLSFFLKKINILIIIKYFKYL